MIRNPDRHEEHVDAEEPADAERRVQVVGHDRDDRGRAQTVELRDPVRCCRWSPRHGASEPSRRRRDGILAPRAAALAAALYAITYARMATVDAT